MKLLLASASLVAAFAVIFASGTPSFAQPVDSPEERQVEGDEKTRAAPAREGEAHAAPPHEGERLPSEHPQGEASRREPGEGSPLEEGIVNWWSWDYGTSATDPSHRGWPPPFGWALVNFIVFLGILSRLVWKPIKAGIVERHTQIKGDIEEASRLRAAAEAQLAEFTKKVAGADREVETLLNQLRKEAQSDRARIIAAAEAEAVQLKAEAEKQIALEIERARAALRKETVEAALKAAEEMLRTRITSDDQNKLGDRYLTDLEKSPPRRRGGVA